MPALGSYKQPPHPTSSWIPLGFNMQLDLLSAAVGFDPGGCCSSLVQWEAPTKGWASWRQPCGTGLGALGVLGGMNPSFGGLLEAVETWKILGDESVKSVNSWPLLANF